MKLSFRNRIATHYMLATAILLALTFSVVYLIVHQTVWVTLDEQLNFEVVQHSGEIDLNAQPLKFRNKGEWEEREHIEVQVNPVFIQLVNPKGEVLDKSPNLKENSLPFSTAQNKHFNATLENTPIRALYKPLNSADELKGYVMAAVSSEAAITLLKQLRNVLIFSFLLLLALIYFISRWLAARSITPIHEMAESMKLITSKNLNERLQAVGTDDEIADLSTSFNALLDRIEAAIIREKQFTSDASHELRTPLATLRGTLEVLIRRPREQHEYEEKVNYSLQTIDHLSFMVEQLLTLARLDSSKTTITESKTPLVTVINEALSLQQQFIKQKKLSLNVKGLEDDLMVPAYYSQLIIDNVLNNAIKYSFDEATISILVRKNSLGIACSIVDEGMGMDEETKTQAFERFYRSSSINTAEIKGNGLGLAIVKKAADAINAEIDVQSEKSKGTSVTINFK